MLIMATMNDFLQYVRKRRTALQRELSELEIAERIYRHSGVQMVPGQESLFEPIMPPLARRSIKRMVTDLLDEMRPHGLTALEIIDQIRVRWNVDVKRTSLSPQLTRLKNDGEIYNDKGVWKRLKETEAPGSVGASGSRERSGVAG